ncbi:hypothetical protein BGZ80_009504 [Entomortierella chlamydospora]|uniref:Uncharacterized protein n=1 Tax=Entomortierella chlamydospora TaxID=101097 RepID=A0A9P6MXH4_9FUNG|nr:hypothetical protein BGZ79_006182 [Entomortierella chlamydospora]KAG0015984.1 hypothetical protein BGZ80_009504 [Entomortierella chlamydospora]
MGQNQSHEEPYHKRHYTLTNQQIQRQNSFSQSTPNLLLNREYVLKRGATFQNNHSTTSLTQKPGITRSSSALGFGGTNMDETASGDSGAGNPTPFMRLLPIKNEERYFDESDESEESEESEEEGESNDDYEGETQRRSRGITASPSFPEEGALNVNSRLSYGHYSRDRADFQRTREEEEEDLSYLSPVSGSLRPKQSLGKSPKHSFAPQPFNHDHPRYFSEDDNTDEGHEEPVLKRYQLYDPPMPTQFATAVEDVHVQDFSRNPLLLDAIREEDEEVAGHSKRPSQVDIDQQDRETSTLQGLQPLQEANRNTANVDTRPSVGEIGLYDNVKIDLDRRIHEAVQQVEQKFQDRVQKLEEQTASLSIASAGASAGAPAQASMRGHDQEQDSIDVSSYHSHGSTALRKEMLSNASQKVDDLDSRVNQMEYLVSFKLNDIENKVQEIQDGHNTIVQTMDAASISQEPKEQPTAISNEIQTYRRSAYNDIDNDLAVMGHLNSSGPVDKASIMELRQELQAFGMRFHELNDGLLTDLMTQLREAKLMLFDSVDEVDKRLGTRVDRIEAEQHAKLLSDIENRIHERVRAMEQTSIRLERCFDKMEGRLGALETVLVSKPRPESMYQVAQQQQQQQDSQLEKELQRATFLDPNAAPESPMPDGRNESSAYRLEATPATTSNTVSKNFDSTNQSTTSHRSHGPRPAKILTTNAPDRQGAFLQQPGNLQTGPRSAEPIPIGARRFGRAMTIGSLEPQGSFGASLPGQQRNLGPQRSLASLGALAPKSAGYVAPDAKDQKAIRRPSSYKELLHFWKAGESTPDLLKNIDS